MAAFGKALGRTLLLIALVTLAPICVGFILWGAFLVIGEISGTVCSWLSSAWNLLLANWPVMLVMAALIVIALSIAIWVRDKKKAKK